MDDDIKKQAIAELSDRLDESGVDIVSTTQLKGYFAERAKQEARRWMWEIRTFREASDTFAAEMLA